MLHQKSNKIIYGPNTNHDERGAILSVLNNLSSTQQGGKGELAISFAEFVRCQCESEDGDAYKSVEGYFYNGDYFSNTSELYKHWYKYIHLPIIAKYDLTPPSTSDGEKGDE